jgi:hypothetical protein
MARLDGAILDVKLKGAVWLPLVDDLIARGMPVIPVTGYTWPPCRPASPPRPACRSPSTR